MNTYTNTYLVKTQTIENYGAHDKDGRFSSGNAYWKFKGGDEYIITGLERIQDAVAFVAARCSNSIGYKEFPVQWEEVSADYQTEYEKNQQEYDGRIVYPANRINVQEELNAKREALYAASAGSAEPVKATEREETSEMVKALAARGPARLDREHGSPYDRGNADSYYGRSMEPHFYEGATGSSERVTFLFPSEVEEYTKGYNENTDFKDWGCSNEDWAELAH
jgi:hypothetical protein